MARPKKGYYIDGVRVPGVTTILSRFKESGGLIHWAWKLGIDGKDYRAERDAAADAGTIAHALVEQYIHDEKPTVPAGTDKEVAKKARRAFKSYLEWEKRTQLEILEDKTFGRCTEVSLTSKSLMVGGTIDAIGVIEGRVCLLDWKSSNGVYCDYILQLAAYVEIWNENNPGSRISNGGAELIRFSKENADFSHHHFEGFDDEIEAFRLMRRLYDLDKKIRKRV
jgi:hypothetical protein